MWLSLPISDVLVPPQIQAFVFDHCTRYEWINTRMHIVWQTHHHVTVAPFLARLQDIDIICLPVITCPSVKNIRLTFSSRSVGRQCRIRDSAPSPLVPFVAHLLLQQIRNKLNQRNLSICMNFRWFNSFSKTQLSRFLSVRKCLLRSTNFFAVFLAYDNDDDKPLYLVWCFYCR